MSAIDRQEALYQRARQDYAAYITQVAGPEKTREEVITAAAEIAAMQSFLENIRTGVFEDLYIDTMLTFEHPLMVLLDDWQNIPNRLRPITKEVIDRCCDAAAHQLLVGSYDDASLSPAEKALIDVFNAQYLDGHLPEGYNKRQPDQLRPVLERRLSDDYRRALAAAARLPDAGEAALAVDDVQRLYRFVLSDHMTRLNQIAALITEDHPLDRLMEAWERSGKCCELSTVVEMAVDSILFPDSPTPPQAAEQDPTAAGYAKDRMNELLRRLGHDMIDYRTGERLEPGEVRPSPAGIQYRQDIVSLIEQYREIFVRCDVKMIDALLTYEHPLDALYKQWADTFQPGDRPDWDSACDIIGWAIHLRQVELAEHRAGDSPLVQFYYHQYPSPAPEQPEAGDDDLCR